VELNVLLSRPQKPWYTELQLPYTPSTSRPKVNKMELGFAVLVSKLPHTGMQFISKEIVITKGSHEEKNHA
jgi:hypothetical protein